MSDARLPSEALDKDEALQPQGMPANESGMTAGEHPVDELQPMFDLRFPEPHSSAVDTTPMEGELLPQADLSSTVAERDNSTFATVSPPDHAEAQAASPPAEALMEVSPIFSALDAVERTSSLGHHGLAPPPVEPAILLPNSPLLVVRLRETPVAESEHPIADRADTVYTPLAEAGSAPADGNVEVQPTPEGQLDPAEQLHGAAAKIAEEASATAEALESLKRLLNHKLPLLETAAAVPAHEATDRMPPAPPPSLPAYQAPVTPPPMVELEPVADLAQFAGSDDPPYRRGFAIGSFLAGFAFSWVIGAALYVYLTMA